MKGELNLIGENPKIPMMMVALTFVECCISIQVFDVKIVPKAFVQLE